MIPVNSLTQISVFSFSEYNTICLPVTALNSVKKKKKGVIHNGLQECLAEETVATINLVFSCSSNSHKYQKEAHETKNLISNTHFISCFLFLAFSEFKLWSLGLNFA